MTIELFIVFVISTLFLVYSWYAVNRRIGFILLLSCFLYLTTFAWIPLNFIAELILGGEFLEEEIELVPLYGVTLFYILFVILSGRFTKSIVAGPMAVYSSQMSQLLIFLSSTFFVMSTFGYIALNGLSFSAGNYGQRLTENAGNGIFMIFFFLFIPVAYLLLLQKINKRGLAIAILVSLIGGMLVYFTLGGSRNILAASILGVIIIAQRLQLIKLRHILVSAFLLIAFVNYLAFVRYGQGLSDDILELIFRYLIDSLSPYDSFNKIYIFFNEGDEEFKGFTHIMAQFNPLIPRAFWPEKPIVPITNAFFFTESVLGILAGTYIISPTLLGGLYIMGGWIGILLGFPVLLVMAIFMERCLYSKNAFVTLFAYSVLPFTFFMVRESIELFVNKTILMFFTFVFIWFLALGTQKLVALMQEKSENQS